MIDKEATEILELLYTSSQETLTTEQIAEETGIAEDLVEDTLHDLEDRYLVNIGVKANATDYQNISLTTEGERTVEADAMFGWNQDIGPDTELYTQNIGREA